MKNNFKIHRNSKIFLISGTVLVAAILLISALLHVGAGRTFDYYTATDISEKLLASVRPLSVTVSIGSVSVEYFFKKKNAD